MNNYEKLAKLAEAATPGPWIFNRFSWNVTNLTRDLDICVYRPTFPDSTEDDPANMTGEFIAACHPAAILAILAERRQLAERVASLEANTGVAAAIDSCADLMFQWAGLSDPAQQYKCYARMMELKAGFTATAPQPVEAANNKDNK